MVQRSRLLKATSEWCASPRLMLFELFVYPDRSCNYVGGNVTLGDLFDRLELVLMTRLNGPHR